MREIDPTLPLGEAAADPSGLEARAQQFASEWLSGNKPRIADYLSQATPAERAALLARLMQVEMDLQSRSGETYAVQDYRTQFPEYAAVVESVLAAQSGSDKLASGPHKGVASTHRPSDTDQITAAPSNSTRAPSAQTAGRSTRRAAQAQTPGSTSFGDYELLEMIAKGGMGVVYRARQVKLNRIVAVKMILAGQFASDDEVQRFYSEAEAAAKLDHPGIVPIYEVNEFDGRHYFSMAFIDGKSLHERVNLGPLPQREAAELVRQVAQAVHYAHQHGVVHRDLKPRNIMLTADGTPKVTDFGLAKRVDSGSELTVSGQVIGTPGYMPPEQAAGKLDAIGPQSDVYGLGGVLYCLLTGRPPFQSASVVETIKQVLETPPALPRLLNPSLDRDLETICLKCLEKEPAHRYPTASELADELQRYLDGEPIKALRIGPLRRGWRWLRKRPLVAALGGSLAVLAVVIALAVGAGQRAISTHRLNTLQREIEAALDAPELTLDYVERMDGLIANLADYDPPSAGQAPARLNAALAKAIRGELSRPRVDDKLVQSLTAAIGLLEPRDAAVAAALRAELGRRQRDWQQVFRLAAPFTDVQQVLSGGYQVLEQQRLQGVGQPGSTSRAATLVPSDGLVQLEAQFDESWETAEKLALSINADQQKGYEFVLRAEESRGVGDDLPSQGSNSAAGERLTFRAARDRDGYFALAIFRNGLPLIHERLHHSQLPAGPLVLRATREQGELQIQARALPGIAFRDPFPLPASQAGVFGVEWPAGVALVALEGRRKPRPATVSPLEQGDELYEQGRYAEALEHYQRQALQTSDVEFIQECQHKQGMCLMQLGRLDDAAGLFEPLMNGVGERWPPLAGCYLWVVRLRQRRENEADTVFDYLSDRFEFAQFATLVPQELRDEIRKSYRSGLESITAIMRYNPGLLRNNQRLAAVDRFFSLDGRGDDYTQLEVSRAYHLLGDLPNALQAAESVAKNTRKSTILRIYCRLLRLNGNAQQALAELDKFETRYPRSGLERDAGLILERARVYAALNQWEQCEQSVDEVYRLHRAERPLDGRMLTYPALMKGMLLERRGAQEPAQELWREAFAAVRPLLRDQSGATSEVLNGLILGSLTGEITDEECQAFFVGVVNRGGDNAFTRQAQSLANPQTLAAAFREMWRSPLGRRYAEAFAFESLSLRDRVKVPVVLAATEFIDQSTSRGELDPAQQQVVFDAAGLIFDRTILEGKMSIAQVAQLILTWKGTTNFLGWSGVASSFDPDLRMGLAYIFGHRFLALGDKPRAKQFFQEVLAEAPADSSLARLAALDQRLIEAQQGRLLVTSDLPEKVQLVISRGDQVVSKAEIGGEIEIDVPAGELQLALEQPHDEYRVSPAAITIAAAGRQRIELRWAWKPAVPGDALTGLLPQPAPAALGSRWQAYHRHPPQEPNLLAWSADGRRVAVAAADHVIRIYDAATKELLSLLPDAPLGIRALTWAPHPTRIVACGLDRRIVAWDSESGRRLFEQKVLPGGVTALAWNAEATEFISSGFENTVRRWTAGGTQVATIQEEMGVEFVACSPDGKWIVARTWHANSGQLKAWEVGVTPARTISAPGESLYRLLSFSPDGKRFAAGDNGKFLRIWNVPDWTPLATLTLADANLIDLAWSADGQNLLLATDSREIWRVPAMEGAAIAWRSPQITGLRCAAFSPDGSSVLISRYDGSLAIVPLAGGPEEPFGEPQRGQLEMAVRPGASKQLALCGYDAKLRLLDNQGHLFREAQLAAGRRVTELAWHPDGSRLAVALNDHSLVLWQPDDSSPATHAAQIADFRQPIAWRGDGQRLMFISEDRKLQEFDPQSGATEPLPQTKELLPTALASGPGGLVAVGRVGGKLLVQDAGGTTIAEISLPTGRDIMQVEFSPDGKSIGALDTDGQVFVRNLASEQIVKLDDTWGQADAFAWNTAGDRIVTVRRDGREMLSSSSGERLGYLSPPSAARSQAARWLSDKHVATAGDDAVLRIWEVEKTSVEHCTVLMSDGGFARFEASGKLLESGGPVENQLIYGVETPQGSLELLRLSQFVERLAAAARSPGARAGALPAIPPLMPRPSVPSSAEEPLPAKQLAILDDLEIEESSGLARCASRDDAVWTHNDSGDKPTLFLVGTSGQTLARYDLEGATIFDWEDLAAFRRGEENYLLVGDIGDNGTKRESLKLYLVREPNVKSPPTERTPLAVAETISLSYEDGPHDCEALAVDSERGVIMLVTKELAEECWLYEAPLADENHQPRIARQIAKLSLPLVTGMDLSPDGQRLVILGGLNAFEFRRQEQEPWTEALARVPRRYALPPRPQGEAIGYRPDGKALWLTSEGERQPLWEVTLPP